MQFIGGGWGDIFLVKIKSKKNMIILTNWSVRKVTFFFLGGGNVYPYLVIRTSYRVNTHLSRSSLQRKIFSVIFELYL